jgi:hypothetical protein
MNREESKPNTGEGPKFRRAQKESKIKRQKIIRNSKITKML